MIGRVSRNASVKDFQVGIMLVKVVHLGQRVAEKHDSAAFGVLARLVVKVGFIVFYRLRGDKSPTVDPVNQQKNRDEQDKGGCRADQSADFRIIKLFYVFFHIYRCAREKCR